MLNTNLRSDLVASNERNVIIQVLNGFEKYLFYKLASTRAVISLVSNPQQYSSLRTFTKSFENKEKLVQRVLRKSPVKANFDYIP